MKSLTDITRFIEQVRLLRECQKHYAELRRRAKKFGGHKLPDGLADSIKASRDCLLRIKRDVDAMLGIDI